MEHTFLFCFKEKNFDLLFQELFHLWFTGGRESYHLISFEIFRHSVSYKIVMQGFVSETFTSER